ncbi:hypothetical protein ACHWQZ_G017612 [Mnemiopsis leidyi]
MDEAEDDEKTRLVGTPSSYSTSLSLEEDEVHTNQEAIRLAESDNVGIVPVDEEPPSESNSIRNNADIGGDSYGTFSPTKSGSGLAKNLTLHQRRMIRNTQKQEFKRLESGMKKKDQVTSKCVVFVDHSLKRANEIKRTYFRIWGKSIKEIEGHLGYMVDHHSPKVETLYNKDDLKCTNPKFVNGTGFHHDALNSVLQLLTGTGWMENTAMFYGWYPTSNLTSSITGKEKTIYYFSLAYFTVGCSYFALSLLLMLANLSKLFKKSAAEQMESKPYSSVVFTWDYNVNNTETSQLKSVTVVQSLKEELDEDAQEHVKRELSTKIGIFFLRIFTNTICIAAMIGTVYLYVHEVLTDSTESRANLTDNCGKLVRKAPVEAIDLEDIDLEDIEEQMAAVWSTYSASIIVSGSNVIFPVFFQLVGNYEMYQFQSTRIGMTLFRMFIMKLFSVSTFLYILYKAAGPSGGNTEGWQTGENTLFYNCWEDYIAAQLYQLIMIDFIIFCTALLLSEVFRGFLVTRVAFLRDRIGLTKPEFNIPKEILDLVYKQMIFWSGFYFAPLLPVLAVIEIIVIFYLKKASALNNVIPPKTVVLNHQSTFTINGLFLISLLIVFVFIGLVIFNFQPSSRCGPFRGYERFTEPLSAVIEHSGAFKRYIVDNVKTTSVFIILLILVGLLIYYYRSLAASRNVTIELLREQVRNEIAGKQVLLNMHQQGSKSREGKAGKNKFDSIEQKRKNLRRKDSRMHGFAAANPENF